MAVTKTTTKHVKINESARRAHLSQREVELLREFVAEMLADGVKPMQAYRRAAVKFELHRR